MESDQVAWADSEVGPDVDDMLRQLDLDRNIEDLVPVDPISQEGLPDDPEQWARAVAALWQTPDQDLLPWEEALESQSSGPPSILLVPEMPPDQPTLAPPPVAARDQVWLEALTWQESSGQKEPAAATPQSQPPAGTERFADLRGDNADT